MFACATAVVACAYLLPQQPQQPRRRPPVPSLAATGLDTTTPGSRPQRQLRHFRPTASQHCTFLPWQGPHAAIRAGLCGRAAQLQPPAVPCPHCHRVRAPARAGGSGSAWWLPCLVPGALSDVWHTSHPRRLCYTWTADRDRFGCTGVLPLWGHWGLRVAGRSPHPCTTPQ